MEHSPEPWMCESWGDKSAPGSQEFCVWSDRGRKDVSGQEIPIANTTEEDARRIVACVNACAGIATNNLEAMGEGGLFELLGRYQSIADDLDRSSRAIRGWNDEWSQR